MYSREKRMKAIELYIKYGKSTADVIRVLGYPDLKTLPKWYGIYLEEQQTGILHDRYLKDPQYPMEKKQAAVDYFLDHGHNISRGNYPGVRPTHLTKCILGSDLHI